MKRLAMLAFSSVLLLVSCNQAVNTSEKAVVDPEYQQMAVDFLNKHPDLQVILDHQGVKSLADLEPNVLYTFDAQGHVEVIRQPESELSPQQFGGRAEVVPYNVIFGSDGTSVKAKFGNKVTCYNTSAPTDSSVDSTGILTGPRGQRSQTSASNLNYSSTATSSTSAYKTHGVIDSGRGNYNQQGMHYAYCNGAGTYMPTEQNWFKN